MDRMNEYLFQHLCQYLIVREVRALSTTCKDYSFYGKKIVEKRRSYSYKNVLIKGTCYYIRNGILYCGTTILYNEEYLIDITLCDDGLLILTENGNVISFSIVHNNLSLTYKIVDYNTYVDPVVKIQSNYALSRRGNLINLKTLEIIPNVISFGAYQNKAVYESLTRCKQMRVVGNGKNFFFNERCIKDIVVSPDKYSILTYDGTFYGIFKEMCNSKSKMENIAKVCLFDRTFVLLTKCGKVPYFRLENIEDICCGQTFCVFLNKNNEAFAFGTLGSWKRENVKHISSSMHSISLLYKNECWETIT